MPTVVMTIMDMDRTVEVLEDGTERVTWEAPQPEPADLPQPEGEG